MKRSRLTSDPQKAREWEQRSRRSLNARSRQKDAERATERSVREQVFARDRGCKLAGLTPGFPCWGELTPHHRRKANTGGAYSMANIVALCVAHNAGLEQDADLAAYVREHHPFFVVREGDDGYEALGRRAHRNEHTFE